MADSPILAKTLATASGHKLGLLMLNAAKAMNAVDLDMVNRLDQQLKRWSKDSQVVAVFLHGAGDKAFCAGGDIRKLYDSMKAQGEEHLKYADAFFTGEYAKNYHVHQFSKPLIAWGNGFVMGGGLGLFIGANHRVGTETLKLAWPEIRIGLFPDVAGSWYLPRLPKPYGHWMALSGSHFNAQDSKTLGLTQYSLAHSQQEAVISGLKSLNFTGNNAQNHGLVRALLRSLEGAPMPDSELHAAQAELELLFHSLDLKDIDTAFRAYQGENPWLKQGIANYLNGCPATAHVIMRQLAFGGSMSLKEVVEWELKLAKQAVRHSDFAEGIRAMVVDKDFKPQWLHKDIDAVSEDYVQTLTAVI